MKARNLIALVACVAVLMAAANTSWSRGFGGGHGGGFGGGRGGGFGGGRGGSFGGGHGGFGGGMGGFSGGGRHAGGFGGSGLSAGGARGGQFGGGQFGGGARGGQLGGGQFGGGQLGGGSMSHLDGNRVGAGGFSGGGLGGGRLGGLQGGGLGNLNFNSRPSRGQLDGFLGLPSDAGLHSAATNHPLGNNFDVRHGSVDGPRGGSASGTAITGPRGATYGRGAAEGPRGGAVAGRGVVGPDGGAAGQAVARGPRGGVAAGGAVRGPGGGVGARGAAVGPRGYAGGFRYVSPSARYANAAVVRRGFRGYGIYRPGWYHDHPGAWFAAGWAAGAAWRAATWPVMGDWFGWYGVAPIYYDYGNNVVYQDNSVYLNGQDVGTSAEYYQQAQDLASTGADASDQGQWLPLGVFALSHGDQTSSNLVLQLAVDKQGVIRGNYTDTASNQTQSVQGSIDKKTQRAAWTIGDNKNTVFDCGLYNLTKDEAPVLVHFGKDRTQQWLLVRLKQDGQQSPPQSSQPTPQPSE